MYTQQQVVTIEAALGLYGKVQSLQDQFTDALVLATNLHKKMMHHSGIIVADEEQVKSLTDFVLSVNVATNIMARAEVRAANKATIHRRLAEEQGHV